MLPPPKIFTIPPETPCINIHIKIHALAYSTCTVWHHSVQHDTGARFKSSEIFFLLFVRYQPIRLICQMHRCKNLKYWDLLVIKTIYGHWRTDLIVPSDEAIWWLQNSRHPTEENITAGGATRGYKGWCMSRYRNLSLLCLPSLQRLHKCLHWWTARWMVHH